MNLRKKTLGIIAAASIGLILVLYTTLSVIISRDFHALEVQYARQDVERAIDALAADLNGLGTSAQEYAEWDDTYAFIRDRNRTYIQSNLIDRTFNALRLNAFVLLDEDQQPALAYGFEPQAPRPAPLDGALLNTLLKQAPLLTHPTPASERSGILTLPDGRPPLLVASRPIVASDGSGPIRGTLILGRFLDGAEVQKLANSIELDMTLEPFDRDVAVSDADLLPLWKEFEGLRDRAAAPGNSGSAPRGPRPGRQAITPDHRDRSAIRIAPASPDHLSGYVLLPDLNGQPALVLQVNLPRDIYQRGQNAIYYLALAVIAVGLFFCGVSLLLIEKLVLSRLTRLSHQVETIGKSGDLSGRLTVNGDDELASLALAIDNMLGALNRYQQERSSAEERYRLLAENSTDLISRETPEGVYAYASPACTALLGYDAEELVGKSRWRFIHPDDRALFELATSDSPDSGHSQGATTYTVQYRMRHKDGNEVWFETTSRTIYAAETGQPQGTISVSRDITSRKRTEQELRDGEASIRNLYQITASRELNFEERLERLLQMGCEQFGLEVGMLVKIDDEGISEGGELQCQTVGIHSLLQPNNLPSAGDSFPLWDTHFQATLIRDQPLYFESAQLANDNSHNDAGNFGIEAYLGTSVTVGPSGYGTLSFWSRSPLGRPFKAVDIELLKLMAQWIGGELERQQAADNLERARDQALEATRAKSEFLAAMSHEIRTPMNSIIGMTHLLGRTALEPKQRDYVAKLQASGRHLLGLINDILDFSKIEAGKMAVEDTTFELERVVESAVGVVAQRAAEKGLELVVRLPPGPLPTFVGDPLRIGQVLINYLSNAVKFTERGEIEVRVSLAPGSALHRQRLRFDVTDTGIGIPEAVRDSLFQSFHQADTSTTRRYGGSGLGLAISKRLAELMGGEVGVTSEPGRGSCFWFTAEVGTEAGVPTLRAPLPDLRGRRVLVVDDSESARSMVAEQLASMTFVPEVAASGAEAVERVRSAAAAGQGFDVVLIDWRMAGMDGVATGEAIKALGLTPSPHLLIITAYGREEVFREAQQAGFEDVLVKPVGASVLFDSLTRVLLPNGARPAARSLPSEEHGESTLPRFDGARVLLVEDNPLNQDVAVELLDLFGVAVTVANDGAEALRQLDEAIPDLVFMDMQMPVMDGLEATRRLRSQGRFAALPVVAMTANAMDADRQRCFDAGMNDFVAKPIDPERLAAVLSLWLRAPTAAASVVRPAPVAALPANAVLLTLPGIDVAEGLSRRNGSLPRFLETLRRFHEAHADDPARIDDALVAGDRATAHRLAHTVKGLCALIGARRAAQAAEALEVALLQAGGDAAAEREAFRRALGEVMQGLAVLPVAPAPSDTTPSPASASAEHATSEGPDRLHDLMARLEAFDAEAVHAWKADREVFRQRLPNHHAAIQAAIERFDFAGALALLRAALGAPSP